MSASSGLSGHFELGMGSSGLKAETGSSIIWCSLAWGNRVCPYLKAGTSAGFLPVSILGIFVGEQALRTAKTWFGMGARMLESVRRWRSCAKRT